MVFEQFNSNLRSTPIAEHHLRRNSSVKFGTFKNTFEGVESVEFKQVGIKHDI